MKPTKEVLEAIETAKADGRVTEGVAVRLPRPSETEGRDMTEKEFQQKVLLYARAHGWLCYHTFDSRRSQPGYPDLTMVRMWGCSHKVIFAELKRQKGQLTTEQKKWLDALSLAGQAVFVWYPSDLPQIEDLLA